MQSVDTKNAEQKYQLAQKKITDHANKVNSLYLQKDEYVKRLANSWDNQNEIDDILQEARDIDLLIEASERVTERLQNEKLQSEREYLELEIADLESAIELNNERFRDLRDHEQEAAQRLNEVQQALVATEAENRWCFEQINRKRYRLDELTAKLN